MSLIESIKHLIGVRKARVGDINRQVTHAPPLPKPAPALRDALDGIEITDEYKRVLDLLNTDCQLIFVSGKAGTGKSTLISYLRATTKKNLAVVAPTGVAALNARGVTIHSFFRFPPRVITEEDIQRLYDRRLYTRLDLLVIDEISMVRADVLDAMDKFLRMNGRYPDRLFGGVQVMMVGDLFQLPPVVARNEEATLFGRAYTSPYFFSAKCLGDAEMTPVELSKVFRQTDAELTEMLNNIRLAEGLDEVVPRINSRCCRSQAAKDALLTLTCTNAAADEVNSTRLAKLVGESRVFHGTIDGRFPVEEDKLPSPMNLALKNNAQVMLTKNDEHKRWVNGTLGIVRKLDETLVQVELLTDRPNAIYDVQRVKWEAYKYEYDYSADRIKPSVIGTYRQFPLMLAWAVTIHKSQGKTLERVEVDLGHGAFAPGQVYVALSRCRSLQDLSLKRPIDPHEVKCDERIKRLYALLAGGEG